MAPVEPDALARTNTRPIALFAAQVLLVVGLTTRVLLTTRRAARSLPPPSSTREQEPVRRRHAIVFSALAFASLASVTTFAVMWRALSYLEWAEKGNHEAPNSLWTGWYGTGDEGVGRWRLGDWISDTDLVRESDAVAVLKPEAFLYTSQHFVGLLANAMLFGIEGRRRNLANWTIASFVILSAVGSLGYALNLFFITILYTPVALHGEGAPRKSTLFTPKPVVYYIPIALSLLALYALPQSLAKGRDISISRYGYLAIPIFLAFAPQITPLSLGYQHTSKAAAHKSYVRAFYALSLTSFVLYWTLAVSNFRENTPPEQASVYDLLKNAIGKQTQSQSTPNRLLSGLSNTAQKLKLISQHPAISVTTLDVLFTTLSLLTWAFTRDLDVEAILENSVLSFLVPRKAEKHVAFEADEKKAEEEDVESDSPVPVTPKKRGRPKKNTLTNGATSSSTAPSTGTLRRSTRKKRSDYEEHAEDAYEPTASAKKDIAQAETDGATTAEDIVHGGEASALALCLAFAGGLGQLAAGVLGAEVTSTGE